MGYSSMKILDVPQSGSVAGVTSSRNRYGQYRRTRAIPVNPGTTFQGAVRDRLALNAAAWRELTDNQRAGWESLALEMTRTDSLGQQITLSGFQAYVSVNNLKLAAGDAAVADAPAKVTPTGLLTATITASTTAHTVAYTATPLGAGKRLFIFASPQRSPGRSFEGDYRLLMVTAAAAASPADIESAYDERFGALVIGNKVFYSLQVYEGGFLSGPLLKSAVIAA